MQLVFKMAIDETTELPIKPVIYSMNKNVVHVFI